MQALFDSLFSFDSPAWFVSFAVAVPRCVSVDSLMNARFALMATPLTSAACASDNAESEDSGCLLSLFSYAAFHDPFFAR